MKVLHVIQRNQLRGAEVFAAQLVRSLKNSSSSQHTLVAIREGSKGAGSVSSIVDIKLLMKQSSRTFGVVSEIRSLGRCIAAQQPDLLVAHGSGTLKLGVLATLRGVKPRIVYRNIGIASFWAGDWKRRIFNKLLLKRIAGVISVSEFTAKDFAEHYGFPEGRIIPIPNGVEGENFASVEREPARVGLRSELGVAVDTLLIASVGSLSMEKRPEDLVNLVTSLQLAGMEVHLVLVGVGSLRDWLESLAREKGVADRVHFLGARDDVPAILRGSDIFALASRSEGMPAVLIEAGMAGLPAVAYDVGAVREVIEDCVTGFVVENANSEDFRNKIVKLVENSDLRVAMGERAQNLYQRQFEIGVVARKYEEAFASLAGAQSSIGTDSFESTG